MEERNYDKELLDVKMAIADINTKLDELTGGLEATRKQTEALVEIAALVKGMASVSDLAVRLTALEGKLEQNVSDAKATAKETACAVRKLEESESAVAEKAEKSIAAVKESLSSDLAKARQEVGKNLSDLESTLRAYIDRIMQDADKSASALKTDFSSGLSKLKAETEKGISAMYESLNSRLTRVESDAGQKINNLSEHCGNQLARFKEAVQILDKRMSSDEEMLNVCARVNREASDMIGKLQAQFADYLRSNDKRVLDVEMEAGVLGSALADLASITAPVPDDEPAEVYEEEHTVFVKLDSAGRVVEIANEDTVGATAVFLGGNPWVDIDRGRGAKFDDPAANGYLEDGIADSDGVLLYCVRDGKLCKRSGAAVRKDRDALPVRKKKGGKA